jgi:hypothetical protein
MRSPSRLLARLEGLGRLLAPPPKKHLFVYRGNCGSTYEASLAAFKIEHSVQPRDEMFVIRIQVVDR